MFVKGILWIVQERWDAWVCMSLVRRLSRIDLILVNFPVFDISDVTTMLRAGM